MDRKRLTYKQWKLLNESLLGSVSLGISGPPKVGGVRTNARFADAEPAGADLSEKNFQMALGKLDGDNDMGKLPPMGPPGGHGPDDEMDDDNLMDDPHGDEGDELDADVDPDAEGGEGGEGGEDAEGGEESLVPCPDCNPEGDGEGDPNCETCYGEGQVPDPDAEGGEEGEDDLSDLDMGDGENDDMDMHSGDSLDGGDGMDDIEDDIPDDMLGIKSGGPGDKGPPMGKKGGMSAFMKAEAKDHKKDKKVEKKGEKKAPGFKSDKGKGVSVDAEPGKGDKPAFLMKKGMKADPKCCNEDDKFGKSLEGHFKPFQQEKFFDGLHEDFLIDPTDTDFNAPLQNKEPGPGEVGYAPAQRMAFSAGSNIAEAFSALLNKLESIEKKVSKKK